MGAMKKLRYIATVIEEKGDSKKVMGSDPTKVFLFLV